LLAPYIELLARERRLQTALVGVTAAVVGVIANLAVFFGVRVLFPDGFAAARTFSPRLWPPLPSPSYA
jgi:hypothetical protein